MKFLFTSLLGCFLITTQQTESKINLVCQKWRLIGVKEFAQEYNPIDMVMSEMLLIKKDGTYEEEMYGGVKIKGQWKFNADSSKLAFAIVEMNGAVQPGPSLVDNNPTDSIIKLTSDTLIYGSLGYYGKEGTYGHDDRYFVREK